MGIAKKELRRLLIGTVHTDGIYGIFTVCSCLCFLYLMCMSRICFRDIQGIFLIFFFFFFELCGVSYAFLVVWPLKDLCVYSM